MFRECPTAKANLDARAASTWMTAPPPREPSWAPPSLTVSFTVTSVTKHLLNILPLHVTSTNTQVHIPSPTYLQPLIIISIIIIFLSFFLVLFVIIMLVFILIVRLIFFVERFLFLFARLCLFCEHNTSPPPSHITSTILHRSH